MSPSQPCILDAPPSPRQRASYAPQPYYVPLPYYVPVPYYVPMPFHGSERTGAPRLVVTTAPSAGRAP